MADSAKEADLVIEAIPEILDLKRKFYAQLNEVAPKDTIFATNTSTLLPSQMADTTGRPEKFLTLHFANQVWKYNTAEIMGCGKTDKSVMETIIDFAKKIGMVPIVLHKEKAGYVLNSLLVPFLNSALELVYGGYAEPLDVDSVWKIATASPLGPLHICDIVGMNTIYNILKTSGGEKADIADWIKKEYIDRNKLGIASGEGFFKYT